MNNGLLKSDFDYDLPPELIAQHPSAERDHSRLLVYDHAKKSTEHRRFFDLPAFLRPGDALVVNETRVLPARLHGLKEGSSGRIEFLLLKRLNGDDWEVILKPGKRAGVGARFVFGEGRLRAEVLGLLEGGARAVRFFYKGVFEERLEELGETPLPPYITDRPLDKARYQTVYAREDGSA
ncbi:MAG: S-adenosylmethionine:tRNA ribosyltransferase-isomerase, partial [Christensenellaceae bacterium]|nr:S-adenosylmethionine:tRNA ribosyltransferase-isomerase [Christensenellaceae bacterium]